MARRRKERRSRRMSAEARSAGTSANDYPLEPPRCLLVGPHRSPAFGARSGGRDCILVSTQTYMKLGPLVAHFSPLRGASDGFALGVAWAHRSAQLGWKERLTIPG